MFVEDLSVLLASWPAVDVTLGGQPVRAIFDAPSALGSVGPFGMAGDKPMLTLATADVPANPIGQAAVVNGVNYLLAEHEPDGTGVSRLLLEVAA